MRGDIPQVAFRLMQQLPVHTHAAPEILDLKEHGSGRSNRTGLLIAGREYRSISAAMRDLRLCQRTIYRMICDGTAKKI